jgi:hypothetical protein
MLDLQQEPSRFLCDLHSIYLYLYLNYRLYIHRLFAWILALIFAFVPKDCFFPVNYIVNIWAMSELELIVDFVATCLSCSNIYKTERRRRLINLTVPNNDLCEKCDFVKEAVMQCEQARTFLREYQNKRITWDARYYIRQSTRGNFWSDFYCGRVYGVKESYQYRFELFTLSGEL